MFIQFETVTFPFNLYLQSIFLIPEFFFPKNGKNLHAKSKPWNKLMEFLFLKRFKATINMFRMTSTFVCVQWFSIRCHSQIRFQFLYWSIANIFEYYVNSTKTKQMRRIRIEPKVFAHWYKLYFMWNHIDIDLHFCYLFCSTHR